MANGNATPKSPNRNAPTGDVGLKGKRKVILRRSSENMSDRKTNSKSSNATSNLAVQNQSRK